MLTQARKLMGIDEPGGGERRDGGVREILLVTGDDEVDPVSLGEDGDEGVPVVAHRACGGAAMVGRAAIKDVEQLADPPGCLARLCLGSHAAILQQIDGDGCRADEKTRPSS